MFNDCNGPVAQPPKMRVNGRPNSARPMSRSAHSESSRLPCSAPERSRQSNLKTDKAQMQVHVRRACSLPPILGRRQDGEVGEAVVLDSAQRSHCRSRVPARVNGQPKSESGSATLPQGGNRSTSSQRKEKGPRARADSAGARSSRNPPLAAASSGASSGQVEKLTSNESAPSKLPKRPPLPGSVGVQKPASSFQAELMEWKRRRGIPTETHIFSITGAFPGIRNALLERGWVENDDRNSSLWEFKYALWQRDIGELGDLDDSQVINYFARNSELVSKVGLCNNLYSCCTLDQVDVDSFFPRCYDLTNTSQVDNFIENFKATTCYCLLRRFVADGGRSAEGGAGSNGFPRSAVITALEVCKRRCVPIDDSLDENPRPLVSDAEWKVLERVSIKKPGRELKPWGRKAAQALTQSTPAVVPVDTKPDSQLSDASDAEDDLDGEKPAKSEPMRDKEDEVLFLAAGQVLELLRPKLPQGGIDGYQNIWILKPAGKSRGRGIQLSARLENILEIGVGRGAEARWIAQKYIEDPMIIHGKKFDIRQWVVVTRWNPLCVWFYQDCYLRFSFKDYDPKKLKNVYAHLTNNSISKHADDFEDCADETMWHSDEFQKHLTSVYGGKEDCAEDPWLDIVQKKMKRAVLASLESTADAIQHRTSSFELFGYDFMVSDNLDVWLIEVNSSPDLSYSTSTTRLLVKSMLEDMVRVLVDVEKFGLRPDRPKRKWGSCKVNSGRFELLEPARRRRQEKCSKLRKDAMQLAIRGTSVNLRKPKKGECPNGPDSLGDAKFDAVALLGAVETESREGAAADDSRDRESASDDESDTSFAELE
mmetsp:Transcript_36388/g.57919  ORF Transcript_36388/g.57919 Transcript_36388/m.57919 type:complete len:823 (+) Transcript_36388:101-2569(+)